ncbi:TetR family transcriptional regulator [Streptomyces sp. UG1]|uniref:TetR family transcriptional regulator n=1 Tax=Streptomyces sp. UG1 TaxID=3417652 RepID=UPI003CEE9980
MDHHRPAAAQMPPAGTGRAVWRRCEPVRGRPGPPVQERSEKTRHRLMRAGAELFDLKGYANATLVGIARAAGVTKGALYFHLASKEDLAEAPVAARPRPGARGPAGGGRRGGAHRCRHSSTSPTGWRGPSRRIRYCGPRSGSPASGPGVSPRRGPASTRGASRPAGSCCAGRVPRGSCGGRPPTRAPRGWSTPRCAASRCSRAVA